jgi:hypothetical protein
MINGHNARLISVGDRGIHHKLKHVLRLGAVLSVNKIGFRSLSKDSATRLIIQTAAEIVAW